MKLRNKRTGEIGTLIVDGAYKFVTNFAVEDDEGNRLGEYDSLTELNEEWGDYEEPEEWWYVDRDGVVDSERRLEESGYNAKQIGNYFESEEEAKRALEKLKAWKRLKDNSFRFTDLRFEYDELSGTIKFRTNLYGGINDDLDLLFGGGDV